MRLMIHSVLIFAVVVSAAAAEKPTPAEDPVSTAVNAIYNLEYDDAINILERFLNTKPDDLKALNRLADAMLRKEMFRQGLMEVGVYGDKGDVYKPAKSAPDPTFDTALTKVLDTAQGIADTRLATRPEDRDALYWSGVVHGTRGIYFFTIKRSYVAALRESKGAVRAHERLVQLEPREIDPLLTLGVNNYVVGSLPWYIRMLAALGGAHGNKDEGLQQIRRVTQEGTEAKQDARFILSLLDMREGNTSEALATLRSLAGQYPRNYLLLQEVAGVYRVQREWNKALETYDEILSHHGAGMPGFQLIPESRLLYLAGQTAISAGELGRALTYFDRGVNLPNVDVYRSRSGLAAANIFQQQQKLGDAKRMYEMVASADPDSEQAKIARKELKNYKSGSHEGE